MRQHIPHNDEPFTLNENELAVLYDMLHERIKQAEQDGISDDHPSSIFREALLHKLTKAIIWAKVATVNVSKQ